MSQSGTYILQSPPIGSGLDVNPPEGVLTEFGDVTLEGLVYRTQALDEHVHDVVQQVKNRRQPIQLLHLLTILERTTESARKCSQFVFLQQEEHKKLHKEMNAMREEMNAINIRSCDQFAQKDDREVASDDQFVSNEIQFAQKGEDNSNNFKQFTLKL